MHQVQRNRARSIAMAVITAAALTASTACAPEPPPTTVPTPKPTVTLLPRSPDSVGELTQRINQQDEPEAPTAQPGQVTEPGATTAAPPKPAQLSFKVKVVNHVLLLTAAVIGIACLIVFAIVIVNIAAQILMHLVKRRRSMNQDEAQQSET